MIMSIDKGVEEKKLRLALENFTRLFFSFCLIKILREFY